MNKSFFAGAAAVVAVVVASTCTFQVSDYQYAIVTRFGAQRTIDEPGLHFKWPAPIESVVRVDGRLQILDPAGAELLTGDIKNLIVDTFMIWSVADPLAYWTKVGTREIADARLTDTLSAKASEVISNHVFSDILSAEQGTSQGSAAPSHVGVQALGEEITKLVAEIALRDFGIEVHAVRIKRLNFPAANKRAIFDRMEAGRTKVANGLRAEGKEKAAEIRIETDAQASKLQSEAQLTATRTRGDANAEVTRIYADAIRLDPEFYEFLRHIELLEDGLGKDSLIILPSDHELVKMLGMKPKEGAEDEEPEERRNE